MISGIDFSKVEYENGNIEEFVIIKLILKRLRHFVLGSYVSNDFSTVPKDRKLIGRIQGLYRPGYMDEGQWYTRKLWFCQKRNSEIILKCHLL